MTIDKKKNEQYTKFGNLSEFTFHTIKIEKNKEVGTIIKSYSKEVGEKGSVPIFTLPQQLKSDRKKETLLGNFITDVEREMTGADFAVLNSGFFRKDWNEGIVTVKDVFEMFPFSNDVVVFQMTGKEVVDMIKAIQGGSESVIQTSGLIQKIKMKNNKREVINVTMSNGSKLDESKIYKIATIDFCVPLKMGEFERIKEWYSKEKGNEKFEVLGDFTDKIGEALKKITNFEPKKYYDENNLRMVFE